MLPFGYPSFLDILELPLGIRTLWGVQALTPQHLPPCHPALEPMLFALCIRKHFLGRAEMPLFSMTCVGRTGAESSPQSFLTLNKDMELAILLPHPPSKMLCSKQISLCTLCFVFLKQDLDQVQLHLEEVRFFDVFGFSEAAGAWQCFMCNNPEKATGERHLSCPLRIMCPWDS